MKNRLIVLLVIIFIPGVFFAQNTNPLEDKNSPAKSSTFGSEKREGNENEKQPKISFKIPMLELFRGEFRLLCERKISNGYGLEVGAGMSFSKDFINNMNSEYMAELWGDPLYDNKWSTPHILPLRTMLKNGQFENGLIFSLALRYYYLDRKFPSFFDVTVKNTNQEFMLNGMNSQEASFKYNNVFITGNFGILFKMSSSKSNFVNSFSLGLGVKIGSWDEYLYNDQQFANSGYYKSGKKRIGVSPVFSIKYNASLYDFIIGVAHSLTHDPISKRGRSNNYNNPYKRY
jgi:hypothetical protein